MEKVMSIQQFIQQMPFDKDIQGEHFAHYIDSGGWARSETWSEELWEYTFGCSFSEKKLEELGSPPCTLAVILIVFEYYELMSKYLWRYNLPIYTFSKREISWIIQRINQTTENARTSYMNKTILNLLNIYHSRTTEFLRNEIQDFTIEELCNIVKFNYYNNIENLELC